MNKKTTVEKWASRSGIHSLIPFETHNLRERNFHMATKPRRNQLSPVSAPELPAELHFLLDSAPVISTEYVEDYLALWDRVALTVTPTNPLEWMWVKDFVDLSWEVIRFRLAKAKILEVAFGEALTSVVHSVEGTFEAAKFGPVFTKQWFAGGELREKVEAWLAQNNLDANAIMGQALLLRAEDIHRIDVIIASCESRRNAALREVDHRRDVVRRLRQTTGDVIEGEFTDVALVPSEAEKAPPKAGARAQIDGGNGAQTKVQENLFTEDEINSNKS
jgi:hypothetical protein